MQETQENQITSESVVAVVLAVFGVLGGGDIGVKFRDLKRPALRASLRRLLLRMRGGGRTTGRVPMLERFLPGRMVIPLWLECLEVGVGVAEVGVGCFSRSESQALGGARLSLETERNAEARSGKGVVLRL